MVSIYFIDGISLGKICKTLDFFAGLTLEISSVSTVCQFRQKKRRRNSGSDWPSVEASCSWSASVTCPSACRWLWRSLRMASRMVNPIIIRTVAWFTYARLLELWCPTCLLEMETFCRRSFMTYSAPTDELSIGSAPEALFSKSINWNQASRQLTHAFLVPAPKLTPSMAKIDWQTSNARRVYNMHRALSNFFPLVTTWHGTILKLLDVRLDHKTRNADTDSSSKISNPMAEVDASVSRKSALDFLNSDSSCRNEQSHSRSSANAGHVQFFRSVNVLKISCRDDNVVVVNRMKINGKTISASDFFNGYMSKRPKEQWRFGL